jgi:hypothetical protein
MCPLDQTIADLKQLQGDLNRGGVQGYDYMDVSQAYERALVELSGLEDGTALVFQGTKQMYHSSLVAYTCKCTCLSAALASVAPVPSLDASSVDCGACLTGTVSACALTPFCPLHCVTSVGLHSSHHMPPKTPRTTSPQHQFLSTGWRCTFTTKYSQYRRDFRHAGPRHPCAPGCDQNIGARPPTARSLPTRHAPSPQCIRIGNCSCPNTCPQVCA